MIAVLMGSRSVGSSSWSAVRGRRKVSVVGATEGDLLKVIFFGDLEPLAHELVYWAQEIDIPEGCTRVKVEHIETSGNLVFVDLR